MIYIYTKKTKQDQNQTKNQADINDLSLQIESLRNELDRKIVDKDSFSEKEIYDISLRLDKLIEKHIDTVNE